MVTRYQRMYAPACTSSITSLVMVNIQNSLIRNLGAEFRFGTKTLVSLQVLMLQAVVMSIYGDSKFENLQGIRLTI